GWYRERSSPLGQGRFLFHGEAVHRGSAIPRRGTFYITTPIYYPNDRLHIGHTYTTVAADALARYHRLKGNGTWVLTWPDEHATVAADALARYHRLKGNDTWFLTGTDEHGQSVERAARRAGKEPLEYIDPIVDWIQQLWATLEISYDDFIRTTQPRHKKRVQQIFQQLYDQGDIYKDTYRGLYCVHCEAFYPEGELTEEGLCPVHEKPVEWVEEESYFFRLSKYGDALLRHIEANP